MEKLISINELKIMIFDKRDLIKFYKKKLNEHEDYLEILEDALKSRTKKGVRK